MSVYVAVRFDDGTIATIALHGVHATRWEHSRVYRSRVRRRLATAAGQVVATCAFYSDPALMPDPPTAGITYAIEHITHIPEGSARAHP